MIEVKEDVHTAKVSVQEKYKRYWNRLRGGNNHSGIPKYHMDWIHLAGKIAGLPGSPWAIRKAAGERTVEVLTISKGAKVLVQELWAEKRRHSPPRINIRNKGPQPDPIMEARMNPFAWAPFAGESDMGESTDKLRVYETIFIPLEDGEGKILAQTLLDTGTIANAINEQTVKRAGLKMIEYVGSRWVMFSGDRFMPLGQVKMDFYFQRRRRARTWTLNFLVVPGNAPFDVLMGRRFIKHAQLFKTNFEALPLGLDQLSKDQKKEIKTRTEERKQENEAIKQKEADEAKERRSKQNESTSSGSSKP